MQLLIGLENAFECEYILNCMNIHGIYLQSGPNRHSNFLLRAKLRNARDLCARSECLYFSITYVTLRISSELPELHKHMVLDT